MNLPAFSVRRPVTTLMVFLGVIVVGLVCLWQLPVDLFPEMELPVISVLTVYEGAAPEDVEEKVTKPLERFLSTVPDLKHITSKSREGVSIISLSFEWGSNLDTRSNEVRDSVGIAKMFLPDGIEDPRVLKLDISRFPILVYGVTARENYPHLEKILEDEVVDPLKQIPGVGSAAFQTLLYRQVNVDLDRESLAARHVTPLDVVQAIIRENEDTPAGNIKVGLTDYLIRVSGEFRDVKPMEHIVIANRNGDVVRLADVGTVKDDFEEIKKHVKINGDPGAVIIIQKQSGANTVSVARAVHKKMEEFKKRLPPDVNIVNIMDGSEEIVLAIRDLTRTLLIGGVLAIIVVLIFLRQWRATLVIALTIPFSLILALILIFFLDYTINMMTLFGMVISIGMIVDNAIVILENITRHREEGERPKEGAIYGASEVSMAIIASTLTTICIFFPIIFVKGVIKIIFTTFAVVVIVVLLGSLFTALTMTPMLSSTLMKRLNLDRLKRNIAYRVMEKALDSLTNFYAGLLTWSLHHRWIVIIFALLIFGSSLFLVPKIGSEFLPEEDKGMIQGTMYMPVGTRVEETARALDEITRIVIDEIGEEERIASFTRCGISTRDMGSLFGEEGSHIGVFGLKLVPRVERKRDSKEISRILRQRIDAMRGILGFEKFRLEGGDPMAGLILGGERPLTVNIIGDDMDLTDKIAEEIREIARNTPGTVDVAVSREKGRPELQVNVDRLKASSIGLNASDVGDQIRASFYGRMAGKYRVKGDEYDIFVRLREEDRASPRDILSVPLRLPDGMTIRADNVADVSLEYGPVEIERKDQGRIVNVTGAVEKRSLGEVVADIEKEIARMEIPSGVQVIMAGQTTEQRESFFWLTLSLIVGIILVYMVMASQFESLIDPFVVMFSVPFAFTGAIWAVFLGGHNISIIIFVGLLMLIGIVVNNAIVLVDYINILRARGLNLFEAVEKAGRARLRPVLMTAFTTIVALIPMAFGKGQAAEIWNPLGLTVLGGLLVSTLVTLLLVPTIYTIFEAFAKRMER